MRFLLSFALVAVVSLLNSQTSFAQVEFQQPQAAVQQEVIQQTQAAVQQGAQTYQQRTVIVNPNAQLVSELRNILVRQSQLGNTPQNNQLLAGLQQLVNQHAGGGTMPSYPQVQVTNNGPGVLLIGQNQYLQPGNSTRVTISGNSIPLTSYNSQTDIIMRHAGNGIAKFWDVDDQRYSFLRRTDTNALQINLGQNVQGYRLER